VALLLFAFAVPASAEVPVVSFEVPTETYVFPIGDLVSAIVSPTISGEPGIVAQFDADFAATFGSFSARIVGQKGILRVCGEEVSQIYVQSEIRSTSVMLALSKPGDAERLVGVMNARSCDPVSDS
jgi:hypothetical protein